MKLYSTHYSPHHSTLPQFAMRGSKIYAQPGNAATGSRVAPWFQMRGNKIYSTMNNPSGHSSLPMYEVRGSNVYTTVHNPEHTFMPVYKIRK